MPVNNKMPLIRLCGQWPKIVKNSNVTSN